MPTLREHGKWINNPFYIFKFMIKQLDKTEMQFSTECSQHTIMIPHSTPGDDKNIIYVDAFPSKWFVFFNFGYKLE
jgi:hypothetical protein